jgi:hypothetical protein
VKGVPDVVCEHPARGFNRRSRKSAGHWLGLDAQNAAAAALTTGVMPAAADEVSALTALQFAAHAQTYQAISAQAAAIHDMFVSTLGGSASSYAATEAANAVATG